MGNYAHCPLIDDNVQGSAAKVGTWTKKMVKSERPVQLEDDWSEMRIRTPLLDGCRQQITGVGICDDSLGKLGRVVGTRPL